MDEDTIVIAGAGPAGLTAAYQILERSAGHPLILEQETFIGGTSTTHDYKGNKIDVGGHRFFSKMDEVLAWWERFLPAAGAPASDDKRLGTPLAIVEGGPDPDETDEVMLVRRRISRIFFSRQFFDYPLSLDGKTILKLGLGRVFKMGVTYGLRCAIRRKPERTLEDLFINRFGDELYATFFRDYTEKVWGVHCREIPADWGRQRIKGLSIARALLAAAKRLLPGKSDDIRQKNVETSLINSFLYPKFGPGQLWQRVADTVTKRGGELRLQRKVVGLRVEGNRVVEVTSRAPDGSTEVHPCRAFFSTMPVSDLIPALGDAVPKEASEVAAGLRFRDFISVGLLVDGFEVPNETTVETTHGGIPDNWIYVQEQDVKLGRIQILNNWSPYMIADPSKIWLALEYFCNEGDTFWTLDDDEIRRRGIAEMAKIGMIDPAKVRDGVVVRTRKAYPAYFGTYERFDVIQSFLDGMENLYPVGRNGMHRYNNMDHSMVTAMRAVDALCGEGAKADVWHINTEAEYHEEKSEENS